MPALLKQSKNCARLHDEAPVSPSLPLHEPSLTKHPHKLYRFYRDGFRSMVLGRTLWKLIAVKLFLIFAVLKLFFFPNFLEKNFSTDAQRSAHVLDNLTRGAAPR